MQLLSYAIEANVYTFSSPEGFDYAANTCDLLFVAGSVPGTSRSCHIDIIDDQIAEYDEPFFVRAFSSDPRATFGFDTTTPVDVANDTLADVLILDDPPGMFSMCV